MERIGKLLKELEGPNASARRFHRVVQGMLGGDSLAGPEVSAFLSEAQTEGAFAMEGGPDDVFRALDWEDDSSPEESLGINETTEHAYGGQGKFSVTLTLTFSY